MRTNVYDKIIENIQTENVKWCKNYYEKRDGDNILADLQDIVEGAYAEGFTPQSIVDVPLRWQGSPLPLEFNLRETETIGCPDD